MNIDVDNLPEYIEAESGRIEYDFIRASSDTFSDQNILAVVCHPHPLHGGTKDNKVVHTLCRAWRDMGVSSIRFNFRGVGRSEGEYGSGVGELEDLISVVRFIRTVLKIDSDLIISGFSFGASIAARFASINTVKALVLIAPPVSYPELASLKSFSSRVLIVQGGEDELVDLEGVTTWKDSLSGNVELVVVPDASHFFHGRLPALKEAVQAFSRHLLRAD